jgi:hypothetical protein
VKVLIGRHLSGAFPVYIGLKDVSSPLLCNFAFEYARKKVQVLVKLDLRHIQGRTGSGYQDWGAEEDIWA